MSRPPTPKAPTGQAPTRQATGEHAAAAAGAAAAEQELLALHWAGRLAEQYPRVPALLAGLDDGGLARAGQALARLDPDDVLAAHAGTTAVTVAVTGHGTLAALTAPLTAELARHGLLLRPHLTGFDSYVFELGDPGSALYASGADLALCVLDPMTVVDELPTPWRPADVERVFAEKLDLLRRLAQRHDSAGRGTLVLNTVPLPWDVVAQLLDHRSRTRLSVIWREANARLLELAEHIPSLLVVDLDPLVAEGLPVRDPRMSTYTKAHLSPQLLARYAREIGHLARHLTGRTKKALALDLDGTLWGGVLGEDGVEGIEVAEGYRGEAFRAMQRLVRQIGSQGVAVSAVSKNEAEPVATALRDHPQMTVREEDFVRVVANWRPKHDNVRELAQALNLGVDSFVFVDDSPYETGLMRRELPEVATVQVDGDEPALHPYTLLRDGWFTVRELTGEDRARTTRYREELVRRDFLESFDSLDDYLGELGVRVHLAPADEQSLPRVSQIALRTNQFNLTTRRMQPADVRAWMDHPSRAVVTIRSADRFGDNGLVGCVFLDRDGDTLTVDNFLLSCRVFSRGVEQTCLSAVLGLARDAGCTTVRAEYRPTAKNHVVASFYPRYGFTTVEDGPAAVGYRHDLKDVVPVPGHVHLTADLGGVLQ